MTEVGLVAEPCEVWLGNSEDRRKGTPSARRRSLKWRDRAKGRRVCAEQWQCELEETEAEPRSRIASSFQNPAQAKRGTALSS